MGVENGRRRNQSDGDTMPLGITITLIHAIPIFPDPSLSRNLGRGLSPMRHKEQVNLNITTGARDMELHAILLQDT